MIFTKLIDIQDPLYIQEQELRNCILLRPIGVPDHAWEMHDHKSWHFVAVENEKVVGCVVLVPLNDAKTKAQLIQMAVAASEQNKGIGGKLVNALLSFAKENNIKEITCHARQEAVAFYLKHNFEVYGKPFTEVGIAHKYMKKLL